MSTFEKTYQYAMNQVMDASSTTNTGKNIAWWIKAALLGSNTLAWKDANGNSITPTGLWAVDSSCDGTTAGTAGDGVDRWGAAFTPANLNYNSEGSAHSWFVLKHTGLNLFLVLNLTGGTYQVSFSVSKTQPTGGTTTNRPTAADEINPSLWRNLNVYPNGGTMKTHIALATDGSAVMMSTQDGQGYNYWGGVLHKFADTHAGDLVPHLFYFNYSGSGAFSLSQLQNGYAWARDAFNLGSYQLSPVRLHDNNGANWIDNLTNDAIDGAYDDLPIYWVISSFPRSLKGRWVDYRWAGANFPNNNTYEPASGQITSLIMGELWIPSYAQVIF